MTQDFNWHEAPRVAWASYMYNFTQEQIQDSVWGNPPAGGANPIFFQKFQKSHEIKEKDPPLELLKRYKSSFSVITLLLEKKINRYIKCSH